MIAGGCQKPGCKCGNHKQLVFTSRCHGAQFLKVTYEAGGSLLFQCAICSQPVAMIQVAKQ